MHGFLQYPAASAADVEFLDESLRNTAMHAHGNTDATDDRSTHPLSQESHSDQRTESMRQWSASENEILDIVAKLADQQPNTISLQTTFFRLGLDSINAVQIAARLRQKGQKVSPIEVLEVSFRLVNNIDPI